MKIIYSNVSIDTIRNEISEQNICSKLDLTLKEKVLVDLNELLIWITYFLSFILVVYGFISLKLHWFISLAFILVYFKAGCLVYRRSNWGHKSLRFQTKKDTITKTKELIFDFKNQLETQKDIKNFVSGQEAFAEAALYDNYIIVSIPINNDTAAISSCRYCLPQDIIDGFAQNGVLDFSRYDSTWDNLKTLINEIHSSANDEKNANVINEEVKEDMDKNPESDSAGIPSSEKRKKSHLLLSLINDEVLNLILCCLVIGGLFFIYCNLLDKPFTAYDALWADKPLFSLVFFATLTKGVRNWALIIAYGSSEKSERNEFIVRLITDFVYLTILFIPDYGIWKTIVSNPFVVLIIVLLILRWVAILPVSNYLKYTE